MGNGDGGADRNVVVRRSGFYSEKGTSCGASPSITGSMGLENQNGENNQRYRNQRKPCGESVLATVGGTDLYHLVPVVLNRGWSGQLVPFFEELGIHRVESAVGGRAGAAALHSRSRGAERARGRDG